MKCFFILLVSISVLNVSAQLGLEDLIVETYYISDANDASDTDGPSGLGPVLQTGSVTYRIYVDMASGYELQAVYGNENHLLRLSTSTTFFNNYDRGEEVGEAINDSRLDENTVALDSWVTIGAASDAHVGILKAIDSDGSIVGGVNNDGGSMGIPGGLLVNENPGAGIPLTQADGLIPGTLPTLGRSPGLDLSVFGTPAVPGNELAIGGGGPGTGGDTWFMAEGVVGPTSENIVLIAQITTDGDFSFELNIQIGTPTGEVEQYVASSPDADEYLFEALNFPDENVVLGCTDPLSCNYDPQATEDNGTCFYPEVDCTECNADGTELILIDDDGDGICNGHEVTGCTDPLSCNYNENATDDDGSCFFPEVDCTECNADGTELVLIDTDGDGICDGQEILGCVDESSCNYNPQATEDDGSCLIPTEDCTECSSDGTELILIDSDEDGVCDSEEIPGCTDPEAINYNPLATDDDGSCEFGVALDEIQAIFQVVNFLENPCLNELGIRISSMEETSLIMDIHALDGRLTDRIQVNILPGENVILHDVSHLQSGVYLVSFGGLTSNVTRTFLKR